jgi:hypothetical protein
LGGEFGEETRFVLRVVGSGKFLHFGFLDRWKDGVVLLLGREDYHTVVGIGLWGVLLLRGFPGHWRLPVAVRLWVKRSRFGSGRSIVLWDSQIDWADRLGERWLIRKIGPDLTLTIC